MIELVHLQEFSRMSSLIPLNVTREGETRIPDRATTDRIMIFIGNISADLLDLLQIMT